MPHYLRDGRVVGWGPTATEISRLAVYFDEVRHIACLHAGDAPASALLYQSERVTLVPLQPAGGGRFRDKLAIAARIPQYVRTILRELPGADAVHVRCPGNLGLIALVLLTAVRRPRVRWVKYAGNWRPSGSEPWSYRVQRWWLRRGLHRGAATVNGRWPGQRPHVHSFLNPCLDENEVAEAARSARDKRLEGPVQLLFVGALNRPKGVERALEIFATLRRAGFDGRLELVGDGPERPAFERLAERLGVSGSVTFHGWLARPALGPVYQRAHVLLFPTSSSEGWPKVLSEAMAYGVVPLAGAVSSIPQILGETRAGWAIGPEDHDGFVAAIQGLVAEPARWEAASRAAVAAAPAFTYEAYLAAVRDLFHTLDVELHERPNPSAIPITAIDAEKDLMGDAALRVAGRRVQPLHCDDTHGERGRPGPELRRNGSNGRLTRN